jgi:NAD(P)-dependent dehydrogenase (short-subunit alcohol dehydrogenase family)
MLLEGKAVVITGAGAGLGRGYAIHAARLGASVLVGDINSVWAEETVGLIKAEGGHAYAHEVDVRSWDQAGELIDRCVELFGHLDGLVNNAGVQRLARPDEQTLDDLQETMAVNVTGTVACSVHALRYMLAANSGSIVNVTSGAHAGLTFQAGYGASKGAVASLTYCWAADLADLGIRVNAFSPYGNTQMFDAANDYLISHGIEPRFFTYSAESNAPVVSFLLSDGASHINGQIVRFDRGELSIMSHPTVATPTVFRDQWTVEDVKAAFSQQLDTILQPSGIVKTKIVLEGSVPAGVEAGETKSR